MTVTFSLQVQATNPWTSAMLLGLTRELARYENDWIRGLVRQAQRYPRGTAAQRAGRGYRRTYRFRRGWRIFPARFVGQDLVAMARNDVPYGPRVVGDSQGAGQGGFFVGRWYIWRDLATSHGGGFARGAQAIITQHLRGVRFAAFRTP